MAELPEYLVKCAGWLKVKLPSIEATGIRLDAFIHLH